MDVITATFAAKRMGAIRALAAMYRERRLMEKISRRIELGLGTAALEARLASVRTLLGIT